MKKNFAGFLGAGALLAAALACVRGDGPPRQPTPAVPDATGPTAGKVLVLDNERTLTGDIERVGGQYRIKRLLGETWLAADKVLRLCGSLEEAYAFLRSRANLCDPDERLRLTDWCRQHGLKEQALAEARAAVALCPEHPDPRAVRVVKYLVEAQARAEAPAAPPPAGPELPHVDVAAESLGLFASRVQPILMNTCARCHTAGRGGKFQLTRTYNSTLSDRRALEQNLAMVLLHVNQREPRASLLLTKAVSLHARGMSSAPLRGRQTPAYRTLERWVLETLAANPQLRDTLPPATATASALPAIPLPPPPSSWGADRAAAPAPAVAGGAPPAPPAQGQAAPPAAGEQPAAGSDPVDPEGFNRTYHPGRKPPG
jgi:hypothetical protein